MPTGVFRLLHAKLRMLEMTQERSVSTAHAFASKLGECKRNEVLQKLVSAWRSRNARVVRRTGMFSLMAATLTACVDSGSSSSDSKNVANPFSVDKNGDEATVSGESVFITSDTALFRIQYAITKPELPLSSTPSTFLTAATIVDGSQAGGLVKVTGFDLAAGVSIDDVLSLSLSGGVTIVGDVSQFDLNQSGVKAIGDGHVWLMIGEEGSPATTHTALLNIQLNGGNITFDMPSDNDAITLLAGTIIDLGGGHINCE